MQLNLSITVPDDATPQQVRSALLYAASAYQQSLDQSGIPAVDDDRRYVSLAANQLDPKLDMPQLHAVLFRSA